MRDPRAAPEVPPLVSSWGTLLVATLSAVLVFLTALAVVAWSRRDVPLARPLPVAERAMDAGPIALLDAGVPLDAGAHDVDAGARVDGGASLATTDAGRPLDDGGAAGDPPDASAPDVLDEEEARALVVARGEGVVACVRDARKRDPASDDRVDVRVARDDEAAPTISLERSPSPFATRCLKDLLGDGALPSGRSVRVVVRARADTLEVVRAEIVAAP